MLAFLPPQLTKGPSSAVFKSHHKILITQNGILEVHVNIFKGPQACTFIRDCSNKEADMVYMCMCTYARLCVCVSVCVRAIASYSRCSAMFRCV